MNQRRILRAAKAAGLVTRASHPWCELATVDEIASFVTFRIVAGRISRALLRRGIVPDLAIVEPGAITTCEMVGDVDELVMRELVMRERRTMGDSRPWFAMQPQAKNARRRADAIRSLELQMLSCAECLAAHRNGFHTDVRGCAFHEAVWSTIASEFR